MEKIIRAHSNRLNTFPLRYQPDKCYLFLAKRCSLLKQEPILVYHHHELVGKPRTIKVLGPEQTMNNHIDLAPINHGSSADS